VLNVPIHFNFLIPLLYFSIVKNFLIGQFFKNLLQYFFIYMNYHHFNRNFRIPLLYLFITQSFLINQSFQNPPQYFIFILDFLIHQNFRNLDSQNLINLYHLVIKNYFLCFFILLSVLINQFFGTLHKYSFIKYAHRLN
jgi:hypothetical protein